MTPRIPLKKKVVSVVTAATLAFGSMVPAVALAAPNSDYVTGAATRAAGPAPEILGITGVEESGQFIAEVDPTASGSGGTVTASQLQDWDHPKYQLMGNSAYNIAPNPYMAYNLANGLTKSDTVAQSGMIVNTRNGSGNGPNAALAAYDSTAATTEVSTTDNGVWTNRPDAITGTGSSTDVTFYESFLSAIDSSYKPSAAQYAFTRNANIIDSMYKTAFAGDQEEKDNSSKSLRYGSARDIALQYEKYIKGIQGYILYCLDDDGYDITDEDNFKTVALVTNVSGDSAGNYTYTLLGNNGGSDGTASTNRYLEATGAVSKNIAGSGASATASSSTLTGVDLIMVGGQSSSGNYSAIMAALTADGLLGRTFWVNENQGYHGAMYGTVMNSVENAQNIGRILGCLYPDYVNQDQMIGYYYNKFYHIDLGTNEGTGAVDNSVISEVIGNAMDGVRNWSATGSTAADLTSWDTSDATSYDASVTQGYIDTGCSFILGNSSDVSSVLLPQAGSSFSIPSAYATLN